MIVSDLLVDGLRFKPVHHPVACLVVRKDDLGIFDGEVLDRILVGLQTNDCFGDGLVVMRFQTQTVENIESVFSIIIPSFGLNVLQVDRITQAGTVRRQLG